MNKDYLGFIVFFVIWLSSNGVFSDSLCAQNSIEILASHTIKDHFNTLENYKNIDECGFTLARENYPSRDIAIQHLKIASKTKVKLIIGCPEILSDMEKTVRLFNGYPSFGGYYLSDEPGAEMFSDLSEKVKRLRSLDSGHYIWINIFPIYANKSQLRCKSYEQYVDNYMKIVDSPFLSFDCYGVTNKGLYPRYYQNLELISSRCRKKNVPFWAYVLTSQFGNYVYPTKGTLSFQAYNNLAYGAQGIEYFSYRRILGHGLNMTVAPVDTDYKKMAIYNIVKELNNEIKFYSTYLFGNKILDVSHLGRYLPFGTKPLKKLPEGLSVESYSGEGFVVSQFTKRGKKYVLFVNKNYKKEQMLTITSSKKIYHISCHNKESKSIVGHHQFKIKAGSLLLLNIP